MRKEQVVAYDPLFDRNNYKNIQTAAHPIEYQVRLDRQNTITKRNLETHLGERFNVLLSKNRLNIENGTIIPQNWQEPFRDLLIRGRDYRKKHGKSVDWQREEAEVEGFIKKIEPVMTDEKTPVGTMMLSISPPGKEGSIYQHNFYDIFTLKQDEHGRYVESRRYSSALTSEDYHKILQNVDKQYDTEIVPTDDYSLSHPVRIEGYSMEFGSGADAVHDFLHRGHEYMRDEDFQEIIRFCTPFILSYINVLCENPSNVRLLVLNYHALLNKADQVAQNIKRREEGKPYLLYADGDNFRLPTYMEVRDLGMQPVREVTTGCGSSSSIDLEDPSSTTFSVSEFGTLTDDLGDREFPCPACGHRNLRPYNEKIPRCQNSECPVPTKVACA